MKKEQIFRLITQLIITTGLTCLFLWQDYSQASWPFFTWLGWLDPLSGAVGLIQNHWLLLLLITLSALILAIYYGRLFCGWFCPVGTILDLLNYGKNLIRWPNLKLSLKVKSALEFVRWIFLGSVVGLLLSGWFIALSMNPLIVWPREVYRVISGSFPWSIIALILLGLVTFPRFWCRFLCPVGSVLNLVSYLRVNKYIIKMKCKLCERCTPICPMQNIKIDPRKHVQYGADCLNCGECVARCPESCLSKEKTSQKAFFEGRRDFLITSGVGLGIFGISLFARQIKAEPVSITSRRWPRLLRPPGALNEEKLAKTCNRCGQCLQVCPTKVLIPTGLEAGLAGCWTPRFVPRRGRCILCMACGQVCPTKSLVPVQTDTVCLGKAQINHVKCLAWANGTKCLLCVETCSKFAIQIDPQQHPVIDPNKCIGCGACEANCPVAGSAVILTYPGETRRN